MKETLTTASLMIGVVLLAVVVIVFDFNSKKVGAAIQDTVVDTSVDRYQDSVKPENNQCQSKMASSSSSDPKWWEYNPKNNLQLQ